MSQDDDWKLPKRREVVDLEGRPALPPLPNAPSSMGPLAHDDAPIELEQRPKEDVVAPPQKRRLPIVPVLVVLALAAAGLVGWRVLAHRMRKNGEIELVNVPAGARLSLDGEPIVGTHLVLPRSRERHAVTVQRPGMPPKIVRFVVDEDAAIDLAR